MSNSKSSGWQSVLHELTRDRRKLEATRIASRDLANLFNMLCTLLENGMPLQKALSALSSDPSVKKHSKLLKRLHNRLVEGTTFHAAIAAYPAAFPNQIVQQVKLGEASGNLPAALRRISAQIESWLTIRNNILQKLSYPGLVVFAGSGLMTFMLTVVVPQFETIYAESKVDLPWVTTAVTGLSRGIGAHWWAACLPVIALVALWLRVRSSAVARKRFDRLLVLTPLLGEFVKDISVLQFLRSIHALSEAGFVPIDAISQACHTVQNKYVRAEFERLATALVHGTKLSSAMNDIEYLIPSSVRQLIMVGEHSGNITKACDGSVQFIEGRLTRRINTMMAAVEPLLTIGLATCIGWIVLAMYMPMFKMFDVLDY